jgi:hypothetical protein
MAMEINYIASKTASKFHHSQAVVRGFMGPVGNGKSVCCIKEGIRLSEEQWPNAQGIRKSRGVIVRNTGPELRTTVLNTWRQWVPDDVAPLVMHPIITAKLNAPLSDGTSIELEVYFLALDNDKDVKKLLSLETTWIFLNEAKELPYSVVKAARERIGRYPSIIDGYSDSGDYKAPRDEHSNYQPCKRKALLMDTNPPDDDHWWYQLAEEGCLRKSRDKDKAKKLTSQIFKFFRGPSPLIEKDGDYIPNPDAENIPHLPGGYQYYKDMIAGNTEDHINVMVMGNYGSISEGRLVYPSYNDAIHCPGEIQPDPSLPIGLGWDFGLTPCVVIGQFTPTGQLKVIDEVVSDDMDVSTFARDHVKPYLSANYQGYTIAFSNADPAGNNRGEGEGKSAIGILNDKYLQDDVSNIIAIPINLGFETVPAPTNDPTLRINGVAQFMNKLVNGEPGYQLSKRCSTVRKGKLGGYCYKRVAIAGSEEKFRDKPDKNKFSHSSDAEQYLAAGFAQGYKSSIRDNKPIEEQPRARGYFRG